MSASSQRARRLQWVVRTATFVLAAQYTAQAAEGSWSSSMTNVLTGFSSRNWTDKNLTTNGTAIALRSCKNSYSGAGVTPTLQLSRQRTLLPDENKGQYAYACGSTSSTLSHNFGRQPAGSYRFTLVAVNGSGGYPDPINVAYVGVTY